jgi:hypothetical protein
MFLCHECISADKPVKILNKAYALLKIEIGRGSWGACEHCKKVGSCEDV